MDPDVKNDEGFDDPDDGGKPRRRNVERHLAVTSQGFGPQQLG